MRPGRYSRDPEIGEVPRNVKALCHAVTELGEDSELPAALDLLEELHGAVGVWIADLRRDRDHWIRGQHRQL